MKVWKNVFKKDGYGWAATGILGILPAINVDAPSALHTVLGVTAGHHYPSLIWNHAAPRLWGPTGEMGGFHTVLT